MADRRQENRRAEDKLTKVPRIKNPWLQALWKARQDIWLVIITLFVVLSLVRIEQEGDERADGQCVIFEGQHLEDVEKLTNTYSYFLTVEEEDYNDAIFKFAVRQLPETEARAYQDTAPEYCDEDGVGLEEPDPPIPDRPKRMSERLKLPPPPPRGDPEQ